MKGTLKKDLPLAKAGEKVFVQKVFETNFSRIKHKDGSAISDILDKDIKEWIDIFVEKKTYDDLKKGEIIYKISPNIGVAAIPMPEWHFRSETFLTREEAEDENKRREWAVRCDKFIPDFKEKYFHPRHDGSVNSNINQMVSEDANNINLGLCFRTREECEKAIKKHDLIRLFYTIR